MNCPYFQLNVTLNKCIYISFSSYRTSSPISRAIFSVFESNFGRFFHEKWGSAYNRGFGIQKHKIAE